MKTTLIFTTLILTVFGKSIYDDGHCHSNPDPHFSTWHGAYYDYHGGCDVVLIKSSLINVHIRTVPVGSYAKISHAAIGVGSDVVELVEDESVFVNGNAPVLPTTVGGFNFDISTSSSQTTYQLSLNGGQYIRVNMWYGSLSVQAFVNGVDFHDATGMCGTWSTLGLIGRDGVTDFTGNGHGFGEEWQVDSSDPVLFSTMGETVCLPAGTGGGGGPDGCRKEGCEPHDDNLVDPEETCRDIQDDNLRANCEFDVKITGDATFAQQPIYVDPFVMPESRCLANNKCTKRGGQCVWKCDKNVNKCVRGLCSKEEDCACAFPRK